MGIAVSLLLIAFGAILTWAVNREPSGLDLDAVGVILMVVGLVGLVLSLIWWQSWWGGGYLRRRAAYADPRYDYASPPRTAPPVSHGRRAVVEEEEVPASYGRRAVVEEEEVPAAGPPPGPPPP
jgi:hypothetical protein